MILFNSMGKVNQEFKSRTPGLVKIFTCGPSVYQRAHIGNYRTFLYEDLVVRYLEYLDYKVERAMNLTDIEDKAVKEAVKNNRNIFEQTEPARQQFLRDLDFLRMKTPIMAMSSTSVDEAIKIIEILINKGFAYEYKGAVFFEALKFKDFGKLYNLDKRKWPQKTVRYWLDTYPGMRWNLGDFILWHKVNDESQHTAATWDSPWGKGRPSWNIQDPAIILQTLGDSVDINCGGIDNIIRHHDYNIAIMETAFDKTYANYYMHGAHLYADGKKMSKSLGNIYYPSDCQEKGFSGEELRYFLIATKHYREKLNYTEQALKEAAEKRTFLKNQIKTLLTNTTAENSTNFAFKIQTAFEEAMNDDLSVVKAIKNLLGVIQNQQNIHHSELDSIKNILNKIDLVLKINILP